MLLLLILNMKHLAKIIFTIAFLMTACNNKKSDTPEKWSEEELTQWYSAGEWQQGFDAVPDESINQREMAIRYHRNPERWEQAFSWLAKQNLENLDTGRHELDGDNLFVMVTEYTPKAIEMARFEAHRNYADIQYVASGQELISVAPIDEVVITEPYDEKNDVMFLDTPESRDLLATPDKFFVFFPNDAHRPSVRVNEYDSSLVRKVVVKVKLDDALPTD